MSQTERKRRKPKRNKNIIKRIKEKKETRKKERTDCVNPSEIL